jgi:hypothetical protein
VKAIETRYAGHRFRSRLEAKWCVFFQQIGIGWEYEPQGYLVNGRAYLPDFYLPESNTWVEVKGDERMLDHAFMAEFAAELPVGESLLFLGNLPEPMTPGDWDWAWMRIGSEVLEGDTLLFGEWVGFGPGRLTRLTETSSSTPFDNCDRKGWLTPVQNMAGPSCEAAYDAARMARFEHGESGAPR